MNVTNNYGRKVVCTVCGCEELHEYKSYTPAFASSIDSVYIGWCIEHEEQALQEYQRCIQEKDRLLQASSNS
jgi:hypothetical protein